ncbi:hypothetical protein [Pseudomonas sp.]|uniref:hypothetical protein n=1 Tax=Pseudomonas sp. TaxID=306 RepID=UPI00260B8221|nr:hypothetical protein [Pseudomonas sp.]
MNSSVIRVAISIAVVTGASSLTVRAANYVNLAPAVGAQCMALAVNDSGTAVGNCSLGSASAVAQSFVANVNGSTAQQGLSALAPGQICTAMGVANSGTISGQCLDENNVNFAVSWQAATPTAAPKRLSPLPSTILNPLLRPADVSTTPTAMNERGGIVGSSFSAQGRGTVVIYAATGNGTAQRVSDFGDDCVANSVNYTLINTYPSIAMNCPNSAGTLSGTIAIRGSTGYTKQTLQIPPEASLCTVKAINDQSQVLGTCLFPNSSTNVPKTAFWPSPTSAPQLLTLPQNAANWAMDLNNAGKVLAARGDSSGISQSLYWDPATGSFGVRPIVPPVDAVTTLAVELADDNTVVLNSTNGDQYATGCTWHPERSMQCLTPIGLGKKNNLLAISQSGGYAVGVSNDVEQNDNAVAVVLP